MRLRESRGRDRLGMFGLTLSAALSISAPIAIAADEPFMVEQVQNGANQEPRNWQVEQWRGGRLRIKRFQNSEDGRSSYDVTGQPGGMNPRGDNNYPGQRNGGRQRPFNNSNMPDPTSADPTMRKPDRFADNPQTDAEGVRHFSNGKHFDLSKMSLDKALDVAKTPDPNIRPGGNLGNQFGGGVANSYVPPASRPLASNFGGSAWGAGGLGGAGGPGLAGAAGAPGRNGGYGGLYPPYRGGGFNSWDQSPIMNRHRHRRARMMMQGQSNFQNF